MKTTIIGSKGFIGRNLVNRLKAFPTEVFTPERNDPSIFSTPLGNVIYCAGLTSDYRERPFDTVRAHVCFLSDLLERAQFESFVYLSSTRVYFNNSEASEESPILVQPNHSDDLFNISKLMGESICLAANRPKVRVVRLSNVCGDDFSSSNFLFSIIKDAVDKKEIVLHTTLDSEKDYIRITDVVELIIRISTSGKNNIYNLASGKNVSNGSVIDIIRQLTQCKVSVSSTAQIIKFPPIQIDKIRNEFNFQPEDCIPLIKELTKQYYDLKR